MNVTVLTEAEIRRFVGMDHAAIAAVEQGFTRLAEGGVTVPPILRVDIPENNGEVDVKTAYVPGLDTFAIKISPGFFDNYRFGLPSVSGLIVVLSTLTGFPQAILLDNGYLTHVRTGAAGAVAAKFLAREQIHTAGVIGSGTQARYQMMALKQVREFQRLMIYGIIPEEVAKYIAEMTPVLGVEITEARSSEEVVKNSDIVVTATPSKKPYLRAEWLHSGLHITAMGADAEEKQELYPDVLPHADLIVCDRKSQCFRLGELHHGLDAGIISENTGIVELGELTSGRTAGRTNDAQITVCDLTGVGVQDTVIASLAFEKAEEQDIGTRIDI